MNLSLRLKTVASFVKRGSRLADIGTDHGYIPIYLVEEGFINEAIAMDINKGPLERAQENIRKAGLENQIRIRLSDGLDKLLPGEADSIIIAGMGGMLIKDILKRGLDVIKSTGELILSPHSDLAEVRDFLSEEGFKIIHEEMLIDEGKYYVIIKAFYTGEKYYLNPEEAAFGKILLEEKNNILYNWLLNEKTKKEKILDGLNEKNTAKSLETSLELIRKGLKIYG